MSEAPAQYEQILYERQGRVGLITLNRPEKLNAWTPTMESEFMDAVGRASSDPQVGALVVTGAGRGFCAGADISGWNQNLSGRAQPPAAPPEARRGTPEVPLRRRKAKPVIAANNGPSVGVGLTMPLACDIRIASDRAR